MSKTDTLILLDVDGVINYVGFGSRKKAHGYDLTVQKARGFDIAFPDYMPAVIQHLIDNYEVHWLTTWRDEANHHILPLLGIKANLPVITDGSEDRWVDWKEAAAVPVVEAALAEGKRVIWIEDFYGQIPMIAGVEYVDTGYEYMLLPWHINDLLPEHLQTPEPEPFDPTGACGQCGGLLGRHKLSCTEKWSRI